MRVVRFILATIVLLIVVVGCSHKQSTNAKNIHDPEIVGSWSDGVGCHLELAWHGNDLVLLSFKDTNSHSYQNLSLKITKESILTKFSTVNEAPKFSGAFSEGLIMIDGRLCHQVLHKSDNL